MTTMQFTVTTAGKNAAWNASNTGTSINITHIQFGSGNKVPAGNEVALLTPQQKATVAAGYKVSPIQIRMSAMFTGAQAYSISEVGLWLGDPDAGGVLFGYWSQATGAVGSKSAGVDFLFTHDMILDASIPPGSVTVTVDSAQSALIAIHEAAANPHPQYPLKGWLIEYGRVEKTGYQDVTTSTWVDVTDLSANIVVTQAPVMLDVDAFINVHLDSAADPNFTRLLLNSGDAEFVNYPCDKSMTESMGSGYSIAQRHALKRRIRLTQNRTYTIKVQIRNSTRDPGQNTRINASDEGATSSTIDSLCSLNYAIYKD